MAASTSYHEPIEQLSKETRDMHRALTSLQEELEAVDWYRQRADACGDSELREILLHNMREEVEHAAMLLEWLRRHDAAFEEQLGHYLLKQQPILKLEEEAEAEPSAAADAESRPDVIRTSTIGAMKGGER